jgi:DNA-directed RNA polymerase specialized sigma24 family protein
MSSDSDTDSGSRVSTVSDSPSVTDLAEIMTVARRIERLEAELEAARVELRQSVTLARRRGETVSEIARRLGVSRARVYQILKP